MLIRQLVGAMMVLGVLVTAVALVAAQVPAARASVMLDYRFKGFFENANQASLAVVAFFPLALALVLTAAGTRARVLYSCAILVFLAALILGTKTGLGIALFSTALVAVYHSARSGSISRSFVSVTLALLLIVAVVPIGLWVLSWANPISFNKVSTLITGGFWDYQSIHSRNLLWDESIRLGMAHPLVGAGAGSMVLDKSHSHNMVLDYFRGMGIAGAAAALLLLVVTASRATGLFVSTLANGRRGRSRDTVTVAFYLGALGFLIGNQISDSFSPSTAYAFWIVYIAAYLSNLDRDWPPRRVGGGQGIGFGVRTLSRAPMLHPRPLFKGKLMLPRQPGFVGSECAQMTAAWPPPKLP
jgi:O-antigen ligase